MIIQHIQHISHPTHSHLNTSLELAFGNVSRSPAGGFGIVNSGSWALPGRKKDQNKSLYLDMTTVVSYWRTVQSAMGLSWLFHVILHKEANYITLWDLIGTYKPTISNWKEVSYKSNPSQEEFSPEHSLTTFRWGFWRSVASVCREIMMNNHFWCTFFLSSGVESWCRLPQRSLPCTGIPFTWHGKGPPVQKSVIRWVPSQQEFMILLDSKLKMRKSCSRLWPPL